MCDNYTQSLETQKEYKTRTKILAVVDGVQLPDFQRPAIPRLKALT